MANRLSDPKRIVEQGYDQIAVDYLKWTTGRPSPRLAYLQKLLKVLPEGSRTLEVGCGAGVPCTQILSQKTKTVAIDISSQQIAMARANAPEAEFNQADIMTLDYANGTFDAIIGFYTIPHLPREEQEILFQRFASWLEEGGFLLVNLATQDFSASIDPNWLGTEMYWSSFDAETNLKLIRRAGFEILESNIVEDEEEDDRHVPFLWVFASKHTQTQSGNLPEDAEGQL